MKRVCVGLIALLLCAGCDTPGDPTGKWFDGPWFANRVDGVVMPALLDEPNGTRRRYEKIELLVLGTDNVLSYQAATINKTNGAVLVQTTCTAVVSRTEQRYTITLHYRTTSECSQDIVEGMQLVREGSHIYMKLPAGRQVEMSRSK